MDELQKCIKKIHIKFLLKLNELKYDFKNNNKNELQKYIEFLNKIF